ncbi:uncharacterized protein LOC107994395 [Apis cerana]|uniref:uncharacterized protein LOC107994395 n=1 Tax=Apis cerana TaxID=7461 RepID=UPI0007E2BE51|nr:uncharacterized protein LOC107994395 [Apis cerana]
MSMLSCPIDINSGSAYESIETQQKREISSALKQKRKNKKKYTFDSSTQLGTVPLESVENLCSPTVEDWKEENVPAYDPWKSTEKRDIIRCLIGGSKTTKMKFKLAERQRIMNLQKENSCNLNLKNNFKHKINVSQLIKNLRKLNLNDIDTLIKNIDMSKLFISENIKKNTFIEEKYTQGSIDKMLIYKFKELMLNHLQK